MSVSLLLLKRGHEIVIMHYALQVVITKRDTNTLPKSQKKTLFFIFCDLGMVKTKNKIKKIKIVFFL